MGRPKSKPHEVRSKMAFVRLREEEWAGLKQLAEDLNETPQPRDPPLDPGSPHRRSGLLR